MSTKRKQRGRAETRQPPRLASHTSSPKKKKKRVTPKNFWIRYLAILGHTVRFIFKLAFCFMLSAHDCASSV